MVEKPVCFFEYEMRPQGVGFKDIGHGKLP